MSDLAAVEWFVAAGTAFVTIAPVELPDKTFVATLVLATRYRPLPVWLGVAGAFAVHVTVAVAAGSLLALLPQTPVRLVAAALFALGAVIMLHGARQAGAAEQEQEEEYGQRVTAMRHGWRAFGASFLLLATAEWGDLSQLLTAGLVASGHPASAVLAGAWLALAAVSGAAVLLGRAILQRVRLAVVRYVAAGVCVVLAVAVLVSALS
jgi:putative Ca2+/H+ antiporter (TMEM165/GDT1 family)